MTKVLVTGDIHGKWADLNTIINKKNPDVVLVCGDFGYWPKHEIFDIRGIKNKDTQIFWVPGNHEDWDSLEAIYGRNGLYPIEMLNHKGNRSNIFYCPIGSTLKLNNYKVLFLGGADSIDKRQRILGYNWFQQEYFNNSDFEFVINNYKEEDIDIIVSHTCPSAFNPFKSTKNNKWTGKKFKHDDPSCTGLNEVLRLLKPKAWYFGHWHLYKRSYDKGCEWVALDYSKHKDRWNIFLNKEGFPAF